MKKLIFSLILMTSLMLMVVGGVSAVHSATVEVSPSGWLEPDEVTTYEFTVTNTGTEDIEEVRITKPIGYPTPVNCGDNPTNWELVNFDLHFCEYYTVTSPIENGESEIFELDVTNPSFGEYTWGIKIDGVTIFVDSTVQTIQNAIDDWETGNDTIVVPEGTYDENIVIDGRNSITIDGSNGVILEPSSGIGFAITESDEITIVGFTINTVGMNAHGIWIGGTPNGYGSSDDLTIIDNVINVNGQSTGIYAEQVTSGHMEWLIEGNTINAPNLGVDLELYDVSDVDVVENTFGVSGSVSVVYSSELSDVSGAVFDENSFSGNGDGAWPGVIPTVWIESTFQSGSGATTVDDVTITNNEFENWKNAAILLGEEGGPTFSQVTNVVINFNKFLHEETDTALISWLDEEVDATYNNWGVTAYEDVLALIDGNVDFDPWLPEDEIAPTIVFDGAPYFGETLEITINAEITEERALDKYVIDFGDPESSEDVFEVNVSGDYNTSVLVSKLYTYSSNGDYFVSITAYDKYGNYAVETTLVSIDDNKYDWRIPLITGWNLISFPMIPTDEDGNIDQTIENAILEKIYDSLPSSGYVVYQYDALTETWSKTDRDGSGGLNYIYPGYAYWVKVTKDTVLKGLGTLDVSGPEEIIPSVNLGRSWNLIGKYGKNNVLLSGETDNLVFDDEIKHLSSFPVMHEGSFLALGDDFNPFEGYWTLLPGNNGNPITYTVSEADYA